MPADSPTPRPTWPLATSYPGGGYRARSHRHRVVAPAVWATACGALAVVGWRTSTSVVYVLGLVAMAVSLARLPVRWRTRVVAASAVLVVGVAVPTAVAAAPSAGRPVASAAAPRAAEGVSSGDGKARVVDGYGVSSVDLAGHVEWSWRPSGAEHLRSVVPLTGGRLVAVAARTTGLFTAVHSAVVLDPHGRESVQLGDVAAPDIVAAWEDVVVVRACISEEAAANERVCTWRGVGLDDGTTAWEVSGRHGSPVGLRPGTGISLGHLRATPPATFTVRDPQGRWTVHHAATGEALPVSTTSQDTRILSAGRRIVVVEEVNGTCSASASWADSADLAWEQEVPCEVLADLEDTVSGNFAGDGGGDFLWLPMSAAQDTTGMVLDLTDGTAAVPQQETDADTPVTRLVAFSDHALAWLDGDVLRGGQANGERWGATVASEDVRRIAVSDQVVVVERDTRPRLLHELVAPDDDEAAVVDVYDAETGERLLSARTATTSDELVVTGDRVFSRQTTGMVLEITG